jgi:hypothetical protein
MSTMTGTSRSSYPTANAKTQTFAILSPGHGSVLELDTAGNAKAADPVRQTGKEKFFLVDVAGELSMEKIGVALISPAR